MNVDLEAAFFTILRTLNWFAVLGSKTWLKDKLLKRHVAVRPPHHQPKLCLFDSKHYGIISEKDSEPQK